MRVLRALFNFAMGQYEDAQGRSLIAENPVKRISQTRAWFRVERRQTVVKAHGLQAWFAGVMSLDSETLRDYLLLMVLTGLRRTFISIAESLDIPAYAIKCLLNHANGADVTAGYIVASTERLRDPMQKITDYVLKAAGIKASADVVPLKQARG